MIKYDVIYLNKFVINIGIICKRINALLVLFFEMCNLVVGFSILVLAFIHDSGLITDNINVSPKHRIQHSLLFTNPLS